jgi:hypothetical protein
MADGEQPREQGRLRWLIDGLRHDDSDGPARGTPGGVALPSLPEDKPIPWGRWCLLLSLLFLTGLFSIHGRHRTWAYSAERSAVVTFAFLLLGLLFHGAGRLAMRRLRRLRNEGRG